MFTVTLDHQGDLVLTWPQGGELADSGDRVYSGHSSTLGDYRYLNAKFEVCSECDPDDLEELRSCPYYTLRYAFDLRDLGLPAESREKLERDLDEDEWFRPDRARLFLQIMNPGPVESAIESGAIDGLPDTGDVICITDTQEMLQDFVQRPELQLFSTDPEDDDLGILPYRRLTRSDVRALDEIRVEFGILQRNGGITESTTTIPLSLCEDFRFGFDITTSDRIAYDYEVIHEFPAMPSNVDGEVLDPGPPVRLRGISNSVRGSRVLGFSFDQGDPTGVYRAELHIDGALHAAFDYVVVAPEEPEACESP